MLPSKFKADPIVESICKNFDSHRTWYVDDGDEWEEEGNRTRGGLVVISHETEMYEEYKEVLQNLLSIYRLADKPLGVKVVQMPVPGGSVPRFKYSHKCIEDFARKASFMLEDARIWLKNYEDHPFMKCRESVLSTVDRLWLCDFKGLSSDSMVGAAQDLNSLLRRLIEAMKSASVQKILTNFSRNSRKLYADTAEWTDKVFLKRGRCLSVRLDVGYLLHMQPDGSGISYSPSISEASKHRRKFLKYLRRHFGEGLLGYAWAMECGLLKGLHFHLWIILDGSLHQQGMSIAKMLGKYWHEQVTEGRGGHYNCNAAVAKYPPDAIGVGMLHRNSESHMRGAMVNARYLTKIDFCLRFTGCGRKTFSHSKI